MCRILYVLLLIAFCHPLFSQLKVDLDRSVPLWMEYDQESEVATLRWIKDENATAYTVSSADDEPQLNNSIVLEGNATSYEIGPLMKGQEYGYHIRKGSNGTGIIRIGIELLPIHHRGRCLVVVDEVLAAPLETEINQLLEDIRMDGWNVDTIRTNRTDEIPIIKGRIKDWYQSEYQSSQTLLLLGHVPVPYSGNVAHDGHNDHEGAWPADLFYGEMDGFWKDLSVNNTTPSRDKNDNVPFDGKYDNSLIPSDVDIEVGRVDFHDLPAFTDDEIELTRKYLIKNHDYKMGTKAYPRSGLVENNFGSFQEGFGQSGWRNFTTMFGPDKVAVENYEVVLNEEKRLFSYACGAGSYTSCSGVGNTSNLWVAKDIRTVFTMTFGSYFGDWDSQNNFLRAALGSGDILTNAWAGRPVWQLYHMAIGKHIGYSTKLTQNASGSFYSQNFSARNAHIALMGDPTLRLHAMQPVQNLEAEFVDGDVLIDWTHSPDVTHGYFVYRSEEGAPWELLAEYYDEDEFTDICVKPNTTYEYMVKSIRLENTGSGSYFNTSLGVAISISSGENPMRQTYYADMDMDGFGATENFTVACDIPPGFTDNDLDCDDANADIYPGAEEIPNNGIDEDCDGMDATVSTTESQNASFHVYPNPAFDFINIQQVMESEMNYTIYDGSARLHQKGTTTGKIDISALPDGVYYLNLISSNTDHGKMLTFYKGN